MVENLIFILIRTNPITVGHAQPQKFTTVRNIKPVSKLKALMSDNRNEALTGIKVHIILYEFRVLSKNAFSRVTKSFIELSLRIF